MRAKSNQFLASTLAVVFGSLVMVSGPVAVAQPGPSGPTPECEVGDVQNQGNYECVCEADGQWVCHEQEHFPR